MYEVGSALPYVQIGCFPLKFCKKNRRGPWKTASPMNAAILLNCGVIAFKMPVSKGEPCVISSGYWINASARSAVEIFTRNSVWIYVETWALVLLNSL